MSMIINEQEQLATYLEQLIKSGLPQILLIESCHNQQQAIDSLRLVAAQLLKTAQLAGHPGYLFIDNSSDDFSSKQQFQGFQRLCQTSNDAKVIIVEDINNLNNNLINVFLKILEELPAQAYIMLTTSNLYALPSTLRSRCHLIVWHPNSSNTCYQQLLVALKEGTCRQLQDYCLASERNWQEVVAACLRYLERHIKYNAGIIAEKIEGIDEENFSKEPPLLLLEKQKELQQIFTATNALHLDKRQTVILAYTLLASTY